MSGAFPDGAPEHEGDPGGLRRSRAGGETCEEKKQIDVAQQKMGKLDRDAKQNGEKCEKDVPKFVGFG